MKTSKTIALTAALMGILGVGTVVKTVYASPSQNAATVTQVSDGDGEANDATEAPQNMQMTGNRSMQMMAQNQTGNQTEKSDGDGETNDSAEEQQEDAKLQSLAKISATQAKQAAETSVGGTASSVKLENENGSLLYAVVIGNQEVKVDAGNGKVLYTENPNQENEGSEASLPKSSIQVPQSNDGGNETNENGK